jgi:hypothetical protein
LVWAYWSLEDWNHPSRTDHYIMSLNMTVKRILSSKPSRHKIEHEKLVFSTELKRQNPPVSKEAAAEMSKAKWLGFVGMKPRTPDQAKADDARIPIKAAEQGANRRRKRQQPPPPTRRKR